MRTITVAPKDRPEHIDPGVAPMLQWLRVDALAIDDSYQRDLKAGNWQAIKRIAAKFKWSRFSPVFVAPIEGGKYAIIDGQHRVHAAAMCGFAEVPCQIVQMTRDEQAASFAAVNGMVTKVTTWQIFKAALTAGEPWAVEAAETAAAGGATLMSANGSQKTKKPGELYGVTSFRKVISSRKKDDIISALQVCTKTEGFADTAELWDTNIIIPTLMALSSRPKALINPAFYKEFEHFDIWAAVDLIRENTKKRIRLGLPYLGKQEQLEAQISDWIDDKFPDVVAITARAAE